MNSKRSVAQPGSPIGKEPNSNHLTVTDDIEAVGWLSEVGMSQYIETFLVNTSIDGKILRRVRLSQIRQQDLSKMGITNYVHQKILMEHIQHVLKYSFHSPVRQREVKSKKTVYAEMTGVAADPELAQPKVAKESKSTNSKPISARRRRSFDTNVWQSISNLRTSSENQKSAADNLREGIFSNIDTKTSAAPVRRRSFDERALGGDGVGAGTAVGSLHDKARQYGNMAQEYDRMLQQLRALQTEHIHRLKQTISCDLASVFFINSVTRDLLMLGDNNTWYRFPMGSGLAGYCAETGHTLNVADVYSDRRFNRNMDIRTGFRTRNALCHPLRSMRGGGHIIGVIEALNKSDGTEFDAHDEESLASCVEQVGNDLGQKFKDLLSLAEKFTGNAVFIGEKVGASGRHNYNSSTANSAKRERSATERESK